MGSIGSKLVQNPTENSKKEIDDEKGIIPHTTPILTPKASRKNLEKHASDPRSPSKHFARTPLELLSAAADKLSNLAIETDQPPIETPLKRHLILGIDPRSPTLELQRTPIIVDNKQPLTNIKDKNLERVKSCALLDSPGPTVSPKLLGSYPVTPKIKTDAYKRKSFVLLETNVDFTETDLDTVLNAKYPGHDVDTCEVEDAKSDTLNLGATTNDSVSENEEELVEDAVEEDSNLEAVEEDVNPEATASIEAITSNEPETVEDAMLHVVGNEEVEEGQNSIEEKCVQENVPVAESEPEEDIDLQQKEATTTPPLIVDVTPKKSKSEPITPHLVNVTANVEELNKKLTNLIFEDEDLVVFPRVVKLKDQSRTPLAERNGNPKVAQKLKVSDKPRKGEYTVNSKIPLFKDKKIKVQCENTPPRNMRVAKSKKSQWDAKDDTMLI